MSVVFFKASSELSTLDQLVMKLHATITSVPTTPWILKSTWFNDAAATGDPASPPAVPVGAAATYATLIYEIGNVMASPWYVKITIGTGGAATRASIHIDCGDGLNGAPDLVGTDLTNKLPTPGGGTDIYGFTCGTASNDAADWYVTANENGFLLFVGNPSGGANGSFLIGCERSRSQAGVAQEDLVLFQYGLSATGPAGQYDDIITNYTGGLTCIARSWNGGSPVTTQADTPLMLRPGNNAASRTISATSFEAPGDGSPLVASPILALGPWLAGGGVRGQARLFMLIHRNDLPTVSSTVNVVQDGVSRVFQAPNATSIANIASAGFISTPASLFALLLATT